MPGRSLGGRRPQRDEIQEALEGRTVWRSPRGESTRAAVAVICTADEARGWPEGVVLTRRSAHLERHPGQWAFPGGKVDAGESAELCARRECREEIGLDLHRANLLGRLDDFETRSGFVVSPFLYWQEESVDFVVDPAEVASVHVVAWHDFDRPEVPRWRPTAGGRSLMAMPVEGSWVHAPTAAILYQAFCLVWRLQWTRVRGAEEPRFAWR